MVDLELQPAHDAERALQPIAVPYLLVTDIRCFIDDRGRRWTDALWHKDLTEHVRYLRDFTLASPSVKATPPSEAECLSEDECFTDVSFVDLPACNSMFAGVVKWPLSFILLWRAARRAVIVHAGVAGWPIPNGWAATIVARLRRRILVINIESAFWRASAGESLSRRLRAGLWEFINRWCVRQASLPLFTQREFARQMLKYPKRGYVFHASWIDEDVLLGDDEAAKTWDGKEQAAPLALLFAARLVPEKGIRHLLTAMAGFDQNVRLDIIGDGELRGAVTKAVKGGSCIRLLEPIPYGAKFFRLLRRYHAVIVPSLTEEQPRIVYDAFSQAVPVLGSRTAGLSDCVADGETGYLATPGDVDALRQIIDKADGDRAALRRAGLCALSVARSYTHREMHRRRWQLLNNVINHAPHR